MINVLSLFDGISCGQVALKRAGISVNDYYASEIDKYTIQVTQKNHPDTIQLGDVTKWKEWDIDFSSVDLIMAGFPCQAWSVAGKQKGDSDPRGALVHDLIEIWNEVKKSNPNVKFLFENIKMKKEFVTYINELFGVEPIEINSALVSAQNRKRLYWTNIEVSSKPKDKNLFIKDIFDKNTGNPLSESTANRPRTIKNIRTHNQKASCLLATTYKLAQANGMTVIKDGQNLRCITPIECERLQTLPDNYTEGVSNTQRYKMLGNGWTVDVISHIFNSLNDWG